MKPMTTRLLVMGGLALSVALILVFYVFSPGEDGGVERVQPSHSTCDLCGENHHSTFHETAEGAAGVPPGGQPPEPEARFNTHLSPDMAELVKGIYEGREVRVTVGDREKRYVFRSKTITSSDFKISSGPTTVYPASYEVFEGRQLLTDGRLSHMAMLAVVNDTVSMAYTTDAGEFLIERDDGTGKLVSKMLVSYDENSTLGNFSCTEIDGRAGVRDTSGAASRPEPEKVEISLAGEASEEGPEKEGGRASHPYFRLGPQYDASLRTIRVLMVSGSTQTGASSNLSSRAASYFTYAATAADVYERQLGFKYQLQELVLIANDSGEPDIEAIPNDPNDNGDDDQLAAWNWAQSYRPKSVHNWGHLAAWVNVDNAPGGWVGWAYLDNYGSNSIFSVSVNERAWTWGVHIHEMGHNVGASHTIGSGGAMNPTVSKSNPQEDFFRQSENGSYTAARDIYNYMSRPGVNNLSGPAALRHPDEMPFGVDDAVSTPMDTPVTFNPLSNDLTATPFFGMVNNLSLVEVGQVYPKSAGTATVSGNEITFSPAVGYTGNVWFSYTLRGDVGNGGAGWPHSADVVVTVGGNSSDPGQNPVISTTADSLTADFSDDVRLNPLLNDEGKGRLWAGGVDALSDVDGTAESYSDGAFFLVSANVVVGNGSVSLETVEMNRNASASTGNTGYLVYTPGASEPSVVEIAYTAEDADGNQATGTIFLNNGDSDGDGMLDEWENSIFGTLNQGATDNPDGDALNNLEEFQAGTDPTVADVILFENMDSDPGWSTEGQWAFGQPAGQGGASGNPDPTSGTGADPHVYGYNLNGDYPNNMAEESLTTSTFDCSGYEDVTLTFQRWLGVESSSWDHASVRVSNGSSGWVEVWSNSSSMSDSDWTQVTYDISAIADGETAVQVRWVMGTTDGSVTYCGWNIDEVLVAADPIRPDVSVVATDAFAAEQGQDPGVWTISRNGDLTEPLTVSFSIGGSATPGDDFTVSHSTSVTIPATQSTTTVTLTPVDDSVFGEIESVELTLLIDSAYGIATPEPVAIAIAENDNTRPEVAAGSDQSVILAGAPWSPADLSPAAWYDASDASTITEAEGGVGAWRDKSPNGLDLSQGDSDRRPQRGTHQINGINTIKFDGNNDTLVTSSNPFGNLIDDAFVITVHRHDGNVNGTLFNLSGSSGNGDRWQAHAPWGSTLYFDVGSVNNRISDGYGVNVGDAILASFYGSMTESVQQVYKNGTLLASGSNPGAVSNPPGNIFVGSGANVQYQNTSIAEMVIIKGTVSPVDRQNLEGYLAHKWGLTGSLPTGHPHRDAPPGGVGAVVFLDATVSDDDGTTPATTWSKVSGPGNVTFNDPSAVDTSVTITESGVYVLRLTADDGIAQSDDDVLVLVVLDEDSDGIDDNWEGFFFGATGVIDGTADSDGDGILDFFEYLYGSLPNDATSSGFRFEVGPEETGTDLVFEWQVQEGFVLGQDYEVWVSTNLTRWDPLPEEHYSLNSLTANGMTELELTLTVDYGSKVFLRLQQP